ncbi:MAG: hypothetical protein ACNA8R_06890 [Nitriliruptoraceae bacterium]
MSAEGAAVPDRRADDELRLVRAALLGVSGTAVPVAIVAGLVVGLDGALGALAGAALVLVLFGGSTATLAYVAARRRDAGIGLQVAGAAVRLPLYLAALSALSGVPSIHARSLAAATAIAIAVTLAVELRLLARLPRLFWVDAAATRPSALAHDTRS